MKLNCCRCSCPSFQLMGVGAEPLSDEP
ncbi:hypothetical protein [Ferrimonas sp. SCSIO 43195]